MADVNTSTLLGRVRAALRGSSNLADGTTEAIAMNAGRDLCTVQALPERTELSRLGCSFVTQMLTADAIAPLGAVPTTAAMLQLYNNEPPGGKSYIIDSVFSYCQTSEGAADAYGIIGQLTAPLVAACPTAYASLQQCLNGKAATSPNAVIGKAVTTAVTNKWFPIGNSVAAVSTTTFGACSDVNVYGLYIIRPQGSFCMHTLAEAVAASKMVMGVRWHEILLDLG